MAFTNPIPVQRLQTSSLFHEKSAGTCGHIATRKLNLRMSSVDEDGDEAPRLLGSRRFARAVSELQKAPTVNDVNRFLWSRRLFRAVEGLQSPKPADFEIAPTPKTSSATRARRVAESEEEAWGLNSPISAFSGTSAESTESGSKPKRPELPHLSDEDLALLARGERVQRQMRDGRVGTGMVVLDVEADIPLVFAVLTDIDRYPERISTVREAITYQTGERLRKTQFQISKFRLKINTELRCRQESNMLEFTVDPERPAPFLEDATGFWYLEDVSEGGATKTRVWLVAGIACSALLPTPIVDYAASKALPRATTWVKPVMEELYKELRELDVEDGGVELFVREKNGVTVGGGKGL